MNVNKKIGILGCGWLGLPFARKLISEGYAVNGSTTSPEKFTLLQESGIEPFLIKLSDNITFQNLKPFLQVSVLVICFPPGIRKGNAENYLNQIDILVSAISETPVKNILFISSTAVYPDLNEEITEETDLTNYNNPLLEAEEKFKNIPDCKTTIIRFGGLLGGSRHPGRFFAGKTGISDPEAPVNLIHIDDCLGIMTQIIRQEKWVEIFNGVADVHPSRKEFYSSATGALGLDLPVFAKVHPSDTWKIICNEKVKQELQYTLVHPDPNRFPF